MRIEAALGQSISPVVSAREEGECVVLAGGQVRHEVRKGSGRGAFLSAAGRVWVAREEVRLERETGGEWRPVGGRAGRVRSRGRASAASARPGWSRGRRVRKRTRAG